MNVFVKKVNGDIAVSQVGVDADAPMAACVASIAPANVVSAGYNAATGAMFVTTKDYEVYYTGTVAIALLDVYETLISQVAML